MLILGRVRHGRYESNKQWYTSKFKKSGSCDIVLHDVGERLPARHPIDRSSASVSISMKSHAPESVPVRWEVYTQNPQAELTDSQPYTCSKGVRIKDQLHRVMNIQWDYINNVGYIISIQRLMVHALFSANTIWRERGVAETWGHSENYIEEVPITMVIIIRSVECRGIVGQTGEQHVFQGTASIVPRKTAAHYTFKG